MNKLKVGDKIRVHGYVMLSGLDAGDYRVKHISTHFGRSTYVFAKPKGRVTVAIHYADSVDSWVNDSGYNNRIEVLQ